MLGRNDDLRDLLRAVLEAIGRPAVITDEPGRIALANRLAAGLVKSAEATDDGTWETTWVTSAGRRWALKTMRHGIEEVLDRAIDRARSRWQLTRRQAEVLAKICGGHSNVTIAADLGISERTVEAHLTAIFRLTCTTSRTDVIAKVFLS